MKDKIEISGVSILPCERLTTKRNNPNSRLTSFIHEEGYEIHVDVTTYTQLYGETISNKNTIIKSSIPKKGMSSNSFPAELDGKIKNLFIDIGNYLSNGKD